MAGFRTHITVSTLTGAALAGAGYATFDLRPETCFLAGGLCSIAGVLPDADSESGQTVRELTGFFALLVPLLLLDEIKSTVRTHESLVVDARLTSDLTAQQYHAGFSDRLCK